MWKRREIIMFNLFLGDVRKVRLFTLFLAVVGLYLVVGCAGTQSTEKPDFVTVTYKTIKTMSELYNMSMGTLGDLYREGKISEADKAKAIKYGERFRKAKDLAVEALISYTKTEGQSGFVLVQTALDEAIRLYGELARYIQPMLTKGEL